MSAQILTANRLSDGAVVYLDATGGWTKQVAEARLAADETVAANLVALGARAVAESKVVEPYLIDVTVMDGEIVPVRYRELIRAVGPSVETIGTV